MKLIAHNKQGASITFTGKTIKEVLAAFDNAYVRNGFKIRIEEEGIVKRIVKKTIR